MAISAIIYPNQTLTKSEFLDRFLIRNAKEERAMTLNLLKQFPEMKDDPDYLFHGTRNPLLVTRSGVLERAKRGYECVSLTRSYKVAQYFASLERDPDADERQCGIFTFSKSNLIELGFEIKPFHDPIFGDDARDEAEEQIWKDIPLDCGALIAVDFFEPIKGIELDPAPIVSSLTDLEICRELMKQHALPGVRTRCALIELRLLQKQHVDPKILQEMRDIHAGGEVPD